MTTTTTANFSVFSNICKNIANELNTMVEIKDYKNYGWAQVSFMTDKFGGTYAIFHFNYETNEVKLQGTVNDKVVKDEDQLRMMVKFNLRKMEQERDLDDVYELINSQN